MSILPRQIPSKFIRNKTRLDVVKAKLYLERDKPTTERGGTMAADMAIPTIFSDKFGRA